MCSSTDNLVLNTRHVGLLMFSYCLEGTAVVHMGYTWFYLGVAGSLVFCVWLGDAALCT